MRIKLSNRVYQLLVVGGFVVFGMSYVILATLFHNSIQAKPTKNEIKNASFSPIIASDREVKISSEDEITDEFNERYKDYPVQDKDTAHLLISFGLQTNSPSILADTVLIVHPSGKREYTYKSFKSDLIIDKVLLQRAGDGTFNTFNQPYQLPEIKLANGDTITVYEEYRPTIQSVSEGLRHLSFTQTTDRNPFVWSLPPLRQGQTYLVFLNVVPKGDDNMNKLSDLRFSYAPTIYARIPVYNDGREFKIKVESSDAAKTNIDTFNPAQSMTFEEASQVDLFVDSETTKDTYLANVNSILNTYNEYLNF